jgi:CheY-like chemotaxis protein
MPPLTRPPHSTPVILTAVLFVLGSTALLLFALPSLSIRLQLLILAGLGCAILLGRFVFRGIVKDSQAAHRTNEPTNQNEPPSRSKHAKELTLLRETSAQAPAESCADDPPAQALLITKHNVHRQIVVSNLRAWGRSCTVVESCVEAICHLLNQMDQGSAAPTRHLIVDAQGLELEMSRFASMLRNEPRLAQVRLLCLKPLDHTESAQQLMLAGYDGIIDIPIEKSQLFAAIEGGMQPPHQAANIIDLGLHRQARHRPGERKTILLAEPNTSDRSRLQRQLDKAGHRVIGVENGEQALDALELKHFDIAVINLRLPIMNGTQVIKLHRFTTPHKHWVPFITLTDQNTPTTLKLCRELKIKACLFKPVPAGELLKIIAAAPSRTLTAETGMTPALLRPEPHFLHADLLDRHILQGLEQLDIDQGFVAELIEIFMRENDAILQEMHHSIKSGQRSRFLEQCQIMLDNAGQLGAFALYEMCLALMLMDQPSFESSGLQRHALLAALVAQTSQAFQDYLTDIQARQTDRN